MLHRSFKAGKCKTSLKLAAARIKLLKNKTEAQLRKMKGELAQLLESGQEQTARIRVEHVVREEKLIAAYDLIEIYCELIVARLPMIESQKNCPIDLKEAISSVVFASPRCADVPELLDVRKHFTTKYGKEFVASALELRPDCGVSRTMVEKLSAKAPDGQTKIKILTTIAQENNVKWDPNSFGEKELKPPEDLLNGPRTFESASKMAVERPIAHLPSTSQMYESSINLSQKDVTGSSLSSQDIGTINTSTPNMTKPNISQPEPRASGSGTEGRDFRSSFKDGHAFSSNRQNWNMEFKDATSAAKAAAESAERASIAARAAAELSSYANITRQYSTELPESSDYDLRDGPVKLTGLKLKGERASNDSVKIVHNSQKSSSYDINPRIENQQIERNEREDLQGVSGSMYDDYGSIKRRSRQSVSSGSSMASVDEDILVTDLPNTDRYQKSSSEVEDVNPNWHTNKREQGDSPSKVSFNKQSEVESVKLPQSMETEKSNRSGEGRIRKQSSKSASSCSHVSNDDDDDDNDIISDSDIHEYGNNGGEHSFIGTSHENVQSPNQPNSKDCPAVVFDDYDWDKDCNFDVESDYNRHEMDSYAPTPIRKSPYHSSSDMHPWSPKQMRSLSLEENSSAQLQLGTKPSSPLEVPSKLDDSVPATFDESDGPTSESEGETGNFELYGRTESSILPHKQNVFTRRPGLSQTDGSHGSMKSSPTREESTGAYSEPWLRSSFDDSKSEDVHPERNQETQLNVGSESTLIDRGQGSMNSSFTEKQDTEMNRKKNVFTRPGSPQTASRHGSMKPSSTRTESTVAYSEPWLSVSFNDSKSEDVHHERHQETQLNILRESTLIDRHQGSMKSSLTEKQDTGMNRKPWLHSSDDDLESDVLLSVGNQETNFGGGLVQTNRGHGSKMTSSTKREPTATGMNREPWLNSSSDDSESEAANIKINQETKLKAGGASWKKLNQSNLSSAKLYPRRSRSPRNLDGLDHEPFYVPGIEEKQQPLQASIHSLVTEVKAKDDFRASGSPDYVKGSEFSDHSSSESDQVLNLRRLPGGFRNKEFVRPPYTRSPSGDTSPLSTQKSAEDTQIVIEHPVHNKEFAHPPYARGPSNDASPLSTQKSAEDTQDQELHKPKSPFKFPKESSSSKGKTIFDSDSDDTEVMPQQPVVSRGYKGDRLSRRTRGSPAKSGASSLSNLARGPEVPVASDFMRKELSPQSSYETETFSKPQNQVVSSRSKENSKRQQTSTLVEQSFKPTPQPQISQQKESAESKLPKTNRSVEPQPSKPTQQSKVSVHDKNFKLSQPSSSLEQPSNSLPASVPSRSIETPKPPSLSKGSDLKEGSQKKPSHVHPKLPDYDTFAAHFESLRRRSS